MNIRIRRIHIYVCERERVRKIKTAGDQGSLRNAKP